jgi:protein-S-isoprenylcysteine O-methyltransferase Ste14
MSKDHYRWGTRGNSKTGERIRHLLEAMFTVLLFGMQSILNAGIFISIMSIPLLPYLFYFLSGQHPLKALEFNIQVMLFAKEFWVGRAIALIGVMVLLLAAAQLLWNRYKGVGLIKTGMYSVVRHPQFFGIITITIGLTVMVLTNSNSNSFQILGLWLIQILGYIAIARYEEWHLSKNFGEEYRKYKRKVPFLFMVKCPSRIPETLFTIFIAVLLSVVLTFFPYGLIRIL